jgi:sigma-B regulation protein RsbU (phosphoserine phosphatase)
MAVGGHPPAILLDTTRVPRPIGARGHLIGVFDFADYEDLRFELRPGASVLLHTDGVTEGRCGDELYGEDRLMRLLHDSVEAAEGLVGRVLDDVLAFQQGVPRDDIALVALRVP